MKPDFTQATETVAGLKVSGLFKDSRLIRGYIKTNQGFYVAHTWTSSGQSILGDTDLSLWVSVPVGKDYTKAVTTADGTPVKGLFFDRFTIVGHYWDGISWKHGNWYRKSGKPNMLSGKGMKLILK